MATNVVSVTPYLINQRSPIPLADVQVIAFPVSGIMLYDCIGSPNRSLSTGVSVYTAIRVLATNDLYYCRETISQLTSLFNA